MKLLQSPGAPRNKYKYIVEELSIMKQIGVKLELESVNSQVKQPSVRSFQYKLQVLENAKNDDFTASYLTNSWLPRKLKEFFGDAWF